MSKFEFISSEAEDYFDVLVQVGFDKPLGRKDIIRVVQIIAETTASKTATDIFEGLNSLEITPTSLTIRFRYSIGKVDSNLYQGEDLSRLRVQFIFYLFAKIDIQYKMADTPFPSEFREFINLPDYLE